MNDAWTNKFYYVLYTRNKGHASFKRPYGSGIYGMPIGAEGTGIRGKLEYFLGDVPKYYDHIMMATT